MIRLLQESDYDQYLPLLRQFRPTDFSRETFVEFVRGLSSMLEVWVYEENDQLLGTITILYEPKLLFYTCTHAHIEDVCVRESHRSQGIGTTLLRHAISRANDRKCRKVVLVCADDLIPFYQRSNFERRGNQMSILLNE